jgi:uncharacterized damage-inducible protein DinB
MKDSILAQAYLKELEAEVTATRKCLERIPESTYNFKPHEKSMTMGYLTLLVAEIPRWISTMIEKSEIDLGTYEQVQPKNTAEMLAHFEKNLEGAKKALGSISDEALVSGTFTLKMQGKLLFSSPMGENISSTLNHWVHHRGQLTVYMRLNDIAVPSIYGPSADDKTFT